MLIVGAGGHGRSVAEAAVETGRFEVVGFLDDVFRLDGTGLQKVWHIPVLGSVSSLEQHRALADAVVVAIGNNEVRRRCTAAARHAGFALATVVHPRSMVSPSAQLGEGTVIMAGAIVGTEAVLGEGVIVNCAAVVDHHAKVDDFGHLGVNAAMAGGSVLGPSAWMQAGSSLAYGVAVPAGRVIPPGTGVAV